MRARTAGAMSPGESAAVFSFVALSFGAAAAWRNSSNITGRPSWHEFPVQTPCHTSGRVADLVKPASYGASARKTMLDLSLELSTRPYFNE